MTSQPTPLLRGTLWNTPSTARLVTLEVYERVAGSGVLILTTEGRVIECSPSGATTLGLSFLSPPLSVEDATRSLHVDDIERARELFQHSGAPEAIEEAIVRVVSTSNTKYVMLRTGRNADNLVVAVVQDLGAAVSFVTDQIDQSRQPVASRVIHESISAFDEAMIALQAASTTALESTGDPAEHQTQVRRVVAAARRATSLANDVVASAGRTRVVEQLIDVVDLLKGLLPTLQSITGEGIDLHMKLGDDLLPVFADPPSVEQLLISVTGALSSTIAVGGQLTIAAERNRVRATYSGDAFDEKGQPRHDSVTISFAGSPLARASDETARSHKASSERIIAECRTLAEATGAKLVLDRSPEDRLALRLVFRVAIQNIATTTVNEGPTPLLPGNPGAVLIVEDEAHVRRAVARILRHAGLEIFEAENGRDALALLETHASDVGLMLADIVMPHMSGWELAARARARLPALRILMMTGQAFPTDSTVDSVLELPCIEKPFALSTLLERVKTALADD